MINRMISTEANGEQVFALLESACGQRTICRRLAERQLECKPAAWWSPRPVVTTRIVSSVRGSNVYVSARPQPFWWMVIGGLISFALFLWISRPEYEILLRLCLAAIVGVMDSTIVHLAGSADEITSALRAEENASSRYRSQVIHAISTVLIVIILGSYALRMYGNHRDDLLTNVDMAGSSRDAVIARLGRPDVELSHDDIRRFATGFNPDCIRRAVRQLDYYGSRFGKGIYCSVYLDHQDRVICVEHGKLSKR